MQVLLIQFTLLIIIKILSLTSLFSAEHVIGSPETNLNTRNKRASEY